MNVSCVVKVEKISLMDEVLEVKLLYTSFPPSVNRVHIGHESLDAENESALSPTDMYMYSSHSDIFISSKHNEITNPGRVWYSHKR